MHELTNNKGNRIIELEQNNKVLKAMFNELLEKYKFLNENAFHQCKEPNKIRIKEYWDKLNNL